MTRNQFPSKALCEQIQLRHTYSVLLLCYEVMVKLILPPTAALNKD